MTRAQRLVNGRLHLLPDHQGDDDTWDEDERDSKGRECAGEREMTTAIGCRKDTPSLLPPAGLASDEAVTNYYSAPEAITALMDELEKVRVRSRRAALFRLQWCFRSLLRGAVSAAAIPPAPLHALARC